MKILCVIDSLGSGGAQRQIVNLAIAFKEKGHNVSFLVYHKNDFYEQTLKENNISIHEIIECNYFERLMKMRRFIRKCSFDAVLSFLEAANFICEIAGLPKRKWELVVGERSANPNIMKSAKLRIYRWCHLLADHVVANTQENIKMIQKINPFLSKKKCHVIYNMIDTKVWKPSFDYIPFNNNKFNLLIAASISNHKNLHGLIEAVNILPEKYKNKLKINWYGSVSDFDYFHKAQQRIKDYKIDEIFSFFAPTHNIMRYMQLSDAVGLFSFYEGLPNVICEGMSLEKPIICSNVSDLALLINNPNLLVNPYSVSSIAAAISFCMDLSSTKLIEEGKKNRFIAEKVFNKETIIEKYLSLFS